MPDSTAADVDAALAAAEAAQKEWAKRPAIERAKALRAIAAKIREHVEPLARTITEEQGKILDLARVEVAFTADYLDYMAEWARRIEGEILESDRPGETIFLFRQPIGVIGGILPWNFPFFLIARKAAPALVTGNTIVIKPSEETPHNAVKFCELLAETDLPPGVINVVHGRGAHAGKALASSPQIGMISFTGSVETGSAIMAAAAAEHHQSEPGTGRQGAGHRDGRCRYRSGGEGHQGIARHQQRPGLQLRRARVRAAQRRRRVHRQAGGGHEGHALRRSAGGRTGRIRAAHQRGRIQESGCAGARRGGGGRDLGHRRRARRTAKAATTTSLPCSPAASRRWRSCRREIFGPVIPVVTFDDLDEAIAFANDSDYGLTSSIYTRDLNVALRACQEIRFGETYINRENFEAMQGFHAGWRKSGIGGADGKHGLYEFTQTHVVYIASKCL